MSTDKDKYISPALAHRFSVFVIDTNTIQSASSSISRSSLSNADGEMSFQTLRGLEVRTKVEPVRVGGINNMQFKVPNGNEYTDLVLSKGKMINGASQTTEWLAQVILQDQKVVKKHLVITLNKENTDPVAAWLVLDAYPIHWKLNDLNAEKSAIAIEEVTLTYSIFKPITL